MAIHVPIDFVKTWPPISIPTRMGCLTRPDPTVHNLAAIPDRIAANLAFIAGFAIGLLISAFTVFINHQRADNQHIDKALRPCGVLSVSPVFAGPEALSNTLSSCRRETCQWCRPSLRCQRYIRSALVGTLGSGTPLPDDRYQRAA